MFIWRMAFFIEYLLNLISGDLAWITWEELSWGGKNYRLGVCAVLWQQYKFKVISLKPVVWLRVESNLFSFIKENTKWL